MLRKIRQMFCKKIIKQKIDLPTDKVFILDNIEKTKDRIKSAKYFIDFYENHVNENKLELMNHMMMLSMLEKMLKETKQ